MRKNNVKDWTLNPPKNILVTNMSKKKTWAKNIVKDWTLSSLKKISNKRDQKIMLNIWL